MWAVESGYGAMKLMFLTYAKRIQFLNETASPLRFMHINTCTKNYESIAYIFEKNGSFPIPFDLFHFIENAANPWYGL